MATSYTFKPIIFDSLILHLDAGNSKSYYGTGSVWYDVTSYQNTGALTNGPVYGTYSGGSILFDGVNDYLDLGTMPNIQLNDSISKTFNIWFRTSAMSNGTLISDMGGSGNRGWLITLISDGRFRFGGSNNLSDANLSYLTSTASSPTYSVGQWTNLCVTYNPATPTASIYKNGTLLVGDIAYILTGSASPIYASYSNSSSNTQVGVYGSVNSPFNGEINIISVYNRALTPQEVLQNYNALKNRFS